MYKDRHEERKIKEYLSELIRTNNYVIERQSDGSNLLRPKIMPEETLHFSTAKMYDIPDDNTIIWRYMDYPKFEYLIKNKKLWMSNPDQFSQDKKEGILFEDFKRFINELLDIAYEQLKNSNITNLSGITFTHNKYRDMLQMKMRMQNVYDYCRKRFYISCWTGKDYESDSHWDRYTKDNNAIAIKTTVGNLKTSLKTYGLFTIAKVQYKNPEEKFFELKTEYMKILTGIWALAGYMLTIKRHFFDADKEIRLMTDNIMENRTTWEKLSCMHLLGDQDFDYNRKLEFEHMTIPIDLSILLGDIVLSPNSDMSFRKQVQNLLNENNLSNVPIYESEINK